MIVKIINLQCLPLNQIFDVINKNDVKIKLNV